MNRFEQLIEHIINDEQDKASRLFHTIVVEKSRDIYEGLVENDLSREPVDNLVDEIESEEHGMQEDDEFDGDAIVGDDEFASDDSDEFASDDSDEFAAGDDLEGDDAFGSDEGSLDGEGAIEDRVMDLESELDALKAEFDALLGDDASGEEGSDLDSDDFGGDEMTGDEFADTDNPGAEDFGAEDDGVIREYVEKVTLPSNKSEGGEVAAGKSAPINKQSIVAKKNDMGGSNANMNKGGSEASPDGTSPKQASNYGTKGKGNLPGAGKFENVPGAKTKGYTDKKSAKTGEEGAVNAKTTLPK